MTKSLYRLALLVLPAAAGGCDPAFFLDWPLQGMQRDAAQMYQQHRYAESAQMYEGALRRQPRDRGLEAELNMGAGRSWIGEADEQLRAGRTADAILPLDRALTNFRRVAILDPSQQAAFDGAAAAYERQGRPDLATQVRQTHRIPNRYMPESAATPTEPAANPPPAPAPRPVAAQR